MSKGKTPSNASEYLRGCYDWAGELQATHGCTVRLSMLPTARRGVWRVVAAAVEVVDGRVVGVRAKVEEEFPGPSRATLEGCMFALVLKLDRALEPLPMERAGQA